jgi:hypothetical protein
VDAPNWQVLGPAVGWVVATALFLAGVLWDAKQRRVARQAEALEALASFVVNGLKSFIKPTLAAALGGWGFEALLVSMRLHAAFPRRRDRALVRWLADTANSATREDSKVERHATLEHLVYAAGLLAKGGVAARRELRELMVEFPVREPAEPEPRTGYALFVQNLFRRFLGDPSLSDRSLARRLKESGGRLRNKR